MKDTHKMFTELLKNTTKGLKSITELAMEDIDKNLPNIENKKHKEFVEKNLSDVLSGKIKPEELIKNIKNL